MVTSRIKQVFTTPSEYTDTPSIQTTLTALALTPHIEGGFFAQTDCNPDRIPNPYAHKYDDGYTSNDANDSSNDSSNDTRAASTMIFYYLTPRSPLSAFHRNKSRTIHTLHRGRGRYVILHADKESLAINGGKAIIESFVVGQDIARGERLQWVVEGGSYKASFLLADRDTDEKLESDGLLISEVCTLYSGCVGLWVYGCTDRLGCRAWVRFCRPCVSMHRGNARVANAGAGP